MQGNEVKSKIHELAYTAAVNQRYHQIKQRHMWLGDKIAKVTVAALSIGALLAVFLPHESKWLEITLASAASLAAIILNVVPVGEWETIYGEMFRSWSDFFALAEQLQLKADAFGDDEVIPDHLTERLAEAMTRECQLDGMEPAANDRLLARCQESMNERMYGKGVRSYDQAMDAYRQRFESAHG